MLTTSVAVVRKMLEAVAGSSAEALQRDRDHGAAHAARRRSAPTSASHTTTASTSAFGLFW